MKPKASGRVALFCLLAGLILWGCGGGGGSKGMGGVAGTVVARQTDPDDDPVPDPDDTVLVGVADANVTWEGRSRSSTRTNFSGGYILNEVEEGFQAIRASKRIGNQTWTGYATVEVAAEVTVVNANITLWPQDEVGDLVGEVRDDRGRVISGAKVFIASELGSYTAVTNFVGRYELPDLPGGLTYTVAASRAGYENDTRQVTIVVGARSTINFRLFSSFNASLSPPKNLTSVAWTYPESLSRSTLQEAYDRIKADLMPRLKPLLEKKMASRRSPPPGSMIEVDLIWTPNNLSYPDETNLSGYGIYRQVGNVGGFQSLDFIRDPLAGFYGDLDIVFTPGQRVRYRITALNTDYPDAGSESGDSNEAQSVPLNRVILTGPANNSQTSGQPTFSWNAVQGARSYLIRIYDDRPTFGLGKPVWENAPEDPIEAELTDLSIKYDGPPLERRRAYYWIVAASDEDIITDASAISVSSIRQFTVQ